MLQGISYQTLSISKAVDVILFKYFENIISNSSGVELCLGRALKDQLDNYLDFKISPEHYKASLVSLKLFRILINFTKVFFQFAAYLDPATHIYLSVEELEKVEKELKFIYPIQRGRGKTNKDGEIPASLVDVPVKEANITMLESFAIEMGNV